MVTSYVIAKTAISTFPSSGTVSIRSMKRPITVAKDISNCDVSQGVTMVDFTFTTRCGHHGSVQTTTNENGEWTWECYGPKVAEESGVHKGVSGATRLHIRIAIAQYLQIKFDSQSIEFKKAAPGVFETEKATASKEDNVPVENRAAAQCSYSSPRKVSSPPSKAVRNKEHTFVVVSTPRRAASIGSKHKLEFSPNRRAVCQACGQRIPKGDLRVGINSPWGSGPRKLLHHQYYHKHCVSGKQKRKLFRGEADFEKCWQEDLEVMDNGKRRRQKTIEMDRADLRDRLFVLRSRLYEKEGAKKSDHPTCLRLSDDTIDNIVFHAPESEDALLNVKGIGPVMFAKYGQPILDEVRKYATMQDDILPSE